MHYAEEIRRKAEDAPRAALSAVAAALWQAFGEGKVTEAEAETLSRVIEERRQASQDHRTGHRTGEPAPLADAGIIRRYGSRPRTPASMGRRRTWAASGRMPAALAAKFTLAEAAVLAVIAAEHVRRGDCRLHIDHLAALAGVGRTTVKNAIREARTLGLVTVEERRVTGFRSDTNVIRLVSPEWLAWVRLKRRPLVEGGVKSATTTHTEGLDLGKSRPADPKKGCRRAAGDPGRRDPISIHAVRGAGGAMR